MTNPGANEKWVARLINVESKKWIMESAGATDVLGALKVLLRYIALAVSCEDEGDEGEEEEDEDEDED